MLPCSKSTLCRAFAVANLCLLIWPGCSRNEQIDVRQERPADGSTAGRQSMSPESMILSDAERVFTMAPDGWSPVEVDGIRKAAFRVERDSRMLEITIIDLATSPGTMLANINRWREQLNLAKITQQELSESVTEIEVAGMTGHYVELLGPESQQPREAILAVVAAGEKRVWFVKLWGDAELALEERERFQQFAETLRFAPAAADRPRPAPPATAGSPLEVRNPAPEESIRYAVAEGWSPAPVSGRGRIAFEIKEGPLTAETTVMGLPGSATQLLPNVNLWRRQIGLENTTQEDLDAAVEALEIDGRPGHYIRLVGPSDIERPLAMLAVLASDGDRTWFFKMFGDSELVLREQERFEEFVRSVTFVPVGGEKND